MNRKPPELHIVDGTKSRSGNATLLPASIKKRIPVAEWMNNPDAWDKEKFVTSTADFLFDVYGIGCDQDQHILAMLADHIDTYIKCCKAINKSGIVTTFNNGATIGPNPYIPIRNKSVSLILQLMNEMGLTARSRLAAGKVEEESELADFLRGPLG
jgi:P27 family predicted phage terminase small subunit